MEKISNAEFLAIALALGADPDDWRLNNAAIGHSIMAVSPPSMLVSMVRQQLSLHNIVLTPRG